MRKRILMIAVAMTAVIGSQAQLLWQVGGGDAKDSSYLFGTHHLVSASFTDSVSGFDDALLAVDAVIGEIETAGMTDPIVMQGVMAHYMAPADSTLTDVLTPEQIDSVDNVLARYTGGMVTVGQMATMKPAVLSTQLTLFMSMEAMPETARTIASGEPLDACIQKRAAVAGKTICGFETIDSQTALLVDTPISGQVDDLMKSVRMAMDGTGVAMARALTEAYCAQNLEAIETLVLDPVEMTPETRERLIDARNRDWIEQLSRILASGRVLVAVGVGHLPGPCGLIALLRSAGYIVEPVR